MPVHFRGFTFTVVLLSCQFATSGRADEFPIKDYSSRSVSIDQDRQKEQSVSPVVERTRTGAVDLSTGRRANTSQRPQRRAAENKASRWSRSQKEWDRRVTHRFGERATRSSVQQAARKHEPGRSRSRATRPADQPHTRNTISKTIESEREILNNNSNTASLDLSKTPRRSRETSETSADDLFRDTVNSEHETVDGTWSEDGRYITIDLGGRKLKLLRASSEADENEEVFERKSTLADFEVGIEKNEKTGLKQQENARQYLGSAIGSLKHRGRPLVNCKVSLIPLQKAGRGNYSINGAADPQVTTTDDLGDYSFYDVPPGPYKLFWLPKGTRRWIRKIEYKPDVVVRRGERAEINGIKLSLKTLND